MAWEDELYIGCIFIVYIFIIIYIIIKILSGVDEMVGVDARFYLFNCSLFDCRQKMALFTSSLTSPFSCWSFLFLTRDFFIPHEGKNKQCL